MLEAYERPGFGGLGKPMPHPAGSLMVPSMTRRLVAAIRKTTRKRIGALVNTHHHLDHTGGNRFFRTATIIASEKCRASSGSWIFA